MTSLVSYLVSMALFGSIGAMVRLLALPAAEIALFRGLLGTLCLFPFLLRRDRRDLARRLRGNAPVLLLSGLALAGNWVLLFEAFRRTSLAVASLCYYTAPVLVAGLSPFLLGEKPSARKLTALAVTFLGLALVSAGSLGGPLGGPLVLAGPAFGLAAAVCYAGLILLNKFVKGLDGLETTLPQLSLATLALALYVGASGGWRPVPAAFGQVALLLVLGLVHTGLGFLLFFVGVRGLKGQTLALLSYLDPLVSVAISLLAFGERLSFTQSLGAFAIASSILSATLPVSRQAG